MARGKKAVQGLTPEEKLAQALVPVEKQPYQIPENWCWVNGNVIFLPMETEKPKGDYFRYIDIDSIDNKRQAVKEPKLMEVSKAPSRASRKLHSGDTIFSMVRPYLKNIAYIDDSISNSIASTGFYICTPCAALKPRYVYYMMTNPAVIDGLNSFMKGDNSPSIRKDDLENFSYPVPPLAEQQRIVDRIESIFAKLDEAKEKAQAVVDGFELRKSAILHKAFTGELTAKWREEHKIEIADWKNYKIDECCKVGSCGTPSRKHPEYYEGSIPWIKTGEIDWNDILDAEEKISDAAVQDSSAKIYEPGVVLVAMYGMGVTRGKAAILRVQAATNQAVCVLQPKNDLLNRYLFYYFMYNYWNIREKSVGGNQLNLSATIIKNFDILIPSIDEQIEIIRILDGLLAKEKAAKEAAESVLDQIDTMKKAVLARAFRGELGTNDPTEESAVELLKSGL